MRHVLTLIAAGPDHRLPGLAAMICKTLRVAAEPVWLAAEQACDLILDIAEPGNIEEAVRALIGEAPVDSVLQPVAGRRRRLLAADLESTIIENEMLDELGSMLGLGSEIADITRRAMNGEIDFAEALSARVALLAGTKDTVLNEAATRIRLRPGAASLVATMRRSGAGTALVTGGFTVFADRVGAELGFDRVIANRLEITDGIVTGRVLSPIVTGETKRQALLAYAAELAIAPAATLAVGDGANDLPMLNAAGLGIAFRAKPAVAAVARTCLNHADLTGLLFAQGYRKTEFAA
ncbi:MAG: phosphoserine phosphatase SerB [Stellaceae bacterium]